MNENQINLIEKIVKELKDNEFGMMHKDVLYEYFEGNENLKTSVISLLQNDLKFIEIAEDTAYRLTKTGYNFTSFQNITNQNLQVKKTESLEIENILTTIALNKWLLKTKWLPYIIAFLSLLFSFYTYFDAKIETEKLNQRIIKLENIKKPNG